MEDKRYAFLIENEIFHIMSMRGNNEDETFLRWSNGFSNEPTGLDISGVSNVAIGSIWDGENFDNSFLPEKSVIYDVQPGERKYAMIDKEKIVFMILLLTNSIPTLKDVFEAAFGSGQVVGMDITSFPEDVSLWWIWNGESFLPPDES
jgi:hypothetical protein